jgi:hypothetical protein
MPLLTSTGAFVFKHMLFGCLDELSKVKKFFLA